MLILGLEDKIPNVKFVTVRAISRMMKIETMKNRKDQLCEHFLGVIEQILKKDKDEDVKF